MKRHTYRESRLSESLREVGVTQERKQRFLHFTREREGAGGRETGRAERRGSREKRRGEKAEMELQAGDRTCLLAFLLWGSS